MEKLNKKGQLGNLYQYVMVFVLVGIVIGIGLVVLGEFSDMAGGAGTINNTDVQTAVNATITSVGSVASDWMPILVIVAIVGIILALVIGAFAFYKGNNV